MINVLRRIRQMNDTEFGMLCNLLGLSESGQSERYSLLETELQSSEAGLSQSPDT